ncbi:MAG TPA: DNA polymerase III subunit delta' [Gemmatimonadaceae bacterium]|nr:DNA polymerase III subunit delta' [Gemmatimonadaceae bacterium]
MANEREEPRATLPWQPLLPWQLGAARSALARRSTWPHALLIHGPDGIGKHALALGFAQALLCETPQADGLACGHCPSCRYAVAGQHPDLMRVELLAPDADGIIAEVDTITIDRIRTLTEFAQLTSHRQRAKVALIEPADRMNVPAANALLKTLEEPPPDTYLILVTEQPARVPPTILSRCRKLAAPLPSAEEARAWLVDQGVASPELVLAQMGGAPLSALACADPAVQSERRAWLAALARPGQLSVAGLAARIEAGGRDERKARLVRAVDWLIAWASDLARVRAGDSARQNPDAVDALARLASQVAPVALFRYHRQLLGERALLAHPLQPRLVAEALLIDYKALF